MPDLKQLEQRLIEKMQNLVAAVAPAFPREEFRSTGANDLLLNEFVREVAELVGPNAILRQSDSPLVGFACRVRERGDDVSYKDIFNAAVETLQENDLSLGKRLENPFTTRIFRDMKQPKAGK
jgi:hypothetical protein